MDCSDKQDYFLNKQLMNYTFEICANSAESCVAAQQGGAHRVELCASMPEGGTTPSWGEIRLARKLIDIRLHVIIRPRGGDFLYSPLEVDTPEGTSTASFTPPDRFMASMHAR